jgi:methyl-accepting chemotaxis protein
MLNNLTLGTKSRICFFILAILCAFAGYVGYKGLSDTTGSLNKIANENMPSMASIVDMKEGAMGVIVGERGLVNRRMMADDLRKAQYAFLKKNADIFSAGFDNYKKIPRSDEEETLFQELNAGIEPWRSAFSKVVSLSNEKDALMTKGVSNDDSAAVDIDQKVFDASIESMAKFLMLDNILNKIKAQILTRTASNSKTATDKTAADISNIIYTIIFCVLLSIIIGEILSRVIKNILDSLMSETKTLITAILDGNLSSRADTAKINFEFRPIVKDINNLLEALIKPLKLAADYVDKIAKGDLPPKITENYNGDFNEMKNNINCLLDTINHLLDETKNVCIAVIFEGKLDKHANASLFTGRWQKLVAGINDIVNSLAGPLKVYSNCMIEMSCGNMPAELKNEYKGEIEVIKNNFNKCIRAVNMIVLDTNQLVESALDGKLSTRADISKHEGDFQKIIDGVNKTLDAVIKPVEEASGCLEQMAKGNLDVVMKGDYKGDHAKIKDALNRTIDSMNEILSQVSIAVDQVDTGSRQVSDASQSLSQSSTESASSIEEISATMQEINSQTRQNAENATQANKLSGDARNSAEEGNDKMHDMKKAMAEINDASASVAKIIKAIDEIAFQTNLLALNAAVEAARAGKHGKGFTVVAEEVRNLAQRSAKAAKETAEMIEGSIKKAEKGAKIAEDTAKSLEIIVAGSAKVTDLIGEIAAAAREQEKAVTQVNQGLTQIDQITQQNTATAEEAAAASEELSSQADDLKGMLAKFSLKKSAAAVNAYVSKQVPAASSRAILKQVPHKQPDKAKQFKAAAPIRRNEKIDPNDIISLDDNEFGKF